MKKNESLACACAERFDWKAVQEIIEPALTALTEGAHLSKAFVRCREVRSASDLLRIILRYVCDDATMEQVAIWATAQDLAALSPAAISFRLRNAAKWMGCLLGRFLLRRRLFLCHGEVRLRLIDATTANRRGSQGTDCRVHLGFDVGSMCLDEAELTDAHEGETLARHSTAQGEILVADCGHAHRAGLGAALANGAHLIVRMNWHNLPVQDLAGTKIDIPAWLSEMGAADTAERPGVIDTPTGTYLVRLVAGRLPAGAAEEARRRSCRQARKKKHKVDPRTLLAAAYCILLTSLPAERWSGDHILELYRIRWQIELQIKRMKSILGLGDIPVQHPDVLKCYILAKLILALTVEEMVLQFRALQWPNARPNTNDANPWRLVRACWDSLKHAIGGGPALGVHQLILPEFQRFLRAPTRKRKFQLDKAAPTLRTIWNKVEQLPLPVSIKCLT